MKILGYLSTHIYRTKNRTKKEKLDERMSYRINWYYKLYFWNFNDIKYIYEIYCDSFHHIKLTFIVLVDKFYDVGKPVLTYLYLWFFKIRLRRSWETITFHNSFTEYNLDDYIDWFY